MIKLLSLVALFSLIFASCENDNERSSTNSKLTEMKALTNSEIGTAKEGKFELTVDKSSIVTTAQEFYTRNNMEFVPVDAKVIEIDKKMYLRIFNKDNYVSTIELVLDSQNRYHTAQVVCTSRACASGGGCVPSGQYCSACKPSGEGGVGGDCSRTTTGG